MERDTERDLVKERRHVRLRRHDEQLAAVGADVLSEKIQTGL